MVGDPPGAARRAAGARAGACRGGQARRSAHGGHRHGPAGRALRRAALHADEGAHRRPPGCRHRGAVRRAVRDRVLEPRRGPRLGRSRVGVGPRRRSAGASADGGRHRGRRAHSRRAGAPHRGHHAGAGGTRDAAAADRVHRRDRRPIASSVTSPGRAWPTPSASSSISCSGHSASSCSTAATRRPSRWPARSSSGSSPIPDTPAVSPATPDRRSWPTATTRRSSPSPMPRPSSRWSRAGFRSSTATSSSSSVRRRSTPQPCAPTRPHIPSASAPTCCCGRWCRTRCCRRSPTWPGPPSSPISVS